MSTIAEAHAAPRRARLPRAGFSGAVVWIVAVGAAARRRRRHQRPRPAPQRRARRAPSEPGRAEGRHRDDARPALERVRERPYRERGGDEARSHRRRPQRDDVRAAERAVSEKTANARIRFLVLGFVVVFGVALARAAYVQVVEGGRYEQLASRQHRETIEIPAARGTIYDRTGEPLAIGEQATTVYADPRNVVAPMKAAIKAGETLGIDPDELYPALRDRTKRFVYVERKADPVKAKDLERLGVMGFGFYPRSVARTRRAGSRRTCSASRERTTRGSTASSARSTRRSRASRDTRSSSAIRSGGRSTSSPHARSGRDGTSSSRSTTSSRRARSSFSRTPSSAGARAAPRRS